MYVNDAFFFDNGYWLKSYERDSEYMIVTGTEKWKNLLERCFVLTKGIITIEILMKAIEDNEIVKVKKNYYIKKVRPEGYLTIKERKAKKAEGKRIREERHKKSNDNNRIK